MSGKHGLNLNWLQRSYLFSVGLLSAWLTSFPAHVAETIYFQYGQLGRSFQISSLEAFIETGEVRSDLRFYFDFLNISEETQQRFRRALITRSDIDPIYLSRFPYTTLWTVFLKPLMLRAHRAHNIKGFRKTVQSNVYTELGENLLNQFVSFIRTEAGNNGSTALRAAIILAGFLHRIPEPETGF